MEKLTMRAAFWRVALFGLVAWLLPAILSTSLAPAAAPITEAIVGRPVPPRLSLDFLRYCAEVDYFATQVVAPMTRPTTYYFSTTGSDAADGLTTGTPKQTIGALNTLIASSGGNCAFLLKCGDNFNASTVGVNGHASADNCTLGSYGAGARPVVNAGTSTLASGGTLWTLGAGSRYTATVSQPGDIWRTLDRTFQYRRVASTAEVESTSYSYFWSAGTLHMNDNGADPDARAFEYTLAATGDDSGVDVLAGCTGWRIDGIEFIGWGADGGSSNQEYGIRFSGNGTDKCVVTNCRSTRSARHNIGHNGGANSGGWMYVANCEAGMDTEAGGIPYVFYQGNGGHEAWMTSSSTPWGAQPITAARTWADGVAVIAHTNSDSTPPGFICIRDHLIPANAQGFGCHQGVVVNNMAHVTDPNAAEAVIIGTRMEKSYGTGSNGTNGHTAAVQGTLEIGGFYQFSNLNTPFESMGSFNPRGFVYNTYFQFDLTNAAFTNASFALYNPAASVNDPKFRGCYFEVISNGTSDFALNYDTNFAGATQATVDFTLGSELSNSVWSVIRKYPTSTADVIRPALVNNSSVLKNNAYWNVSADGTYAGISNTVSAVTLTHPPIFGATPAQGSPLARTGLGGQIPYDFRRLARDAVQPTIGPGEMTQRILIDPTSAEMAQQVWALSNATAIGTSGSVGEAFAAVKTRTDYLPPIPAGTAGGLFIAGSNAATTVNLTGNLTGNVSGSVGSVTGNVGGVAGAISTLDALNSSQNLQHTNTQGTLAVAVTNATAAAANSSAGAIRTAVFDATLSSFNASSSVGQTLNWLKATMSGAGVFTQPALAEAPSGPGGGATPIAPIAVAPARTWRADAFDPSRAANVLTLKAPFAKTLAVELPLNPDADVETIDAVTCTPPSGTVTPTNFKLTADGRIVHFDVGTLTTVGTYAFTVTATTKDGQTISLQCKLALK